MPNCIALFAELQQQRGCYHVKPRPALKCADAVAIGPELAVEKFRIEQKMIMAPDPYSVDVDDVVTRVVNRVLRRRQENMPLGPGQPPIGTPDEEPGP